VALHATDPASVYLASFARMRSPQVATIQRGLYEDRTVVRMLGMRRTLFVVPVDLLPVVQGSCTHPIGGPRTAPVAPADSAAGHQR
jgi:ABC-type Co2+ transport system permease subunit